MIRHLAQSRPYSLVHLDVDRELDLISEDRRFLAHDLEKARRLLRKIFWILFHETKIESYHASEIGEGRLARQTSLPGQTSYMWRTAAAAQTEKGVGATVGEHRHSRWHAALSFTLLQDESSHGCDCCQLCRRAESLGHRDIHHRSGRPNL